jgi:hypothetical protein
MFCFAEARRGSSLQSYSQEGDPGFCDVLRRNMAIYPGDQTGTVSVIGRFFSRLRPKMEKPSQAALKYW